MQSTAGLAGSSPRGGVGTMLRDKVLVVTGAGRGIGRAIALAAASEGARVVIVDNGTSRSGEGEDQDPAAAVVAEIVAAGGAAIPCTESVTDAAAAERVIALATEKWGRVDAIVNNAGVIRMRAFPEPDIEDFETQIRVNLVGAFNMARAAAPQFKTQKSGAFVHMTSSTGLIGSPYLPGYCASKLGIAALSRSLSFDLTDYNVRSNCIAPSAATRMTESAGDSDAARAYAAEMRRIARPEQVAPLALFLSSDAAQGVTGQIFGTRGDQIFLYSQPRPVRIAHRGAGWTAQSIARDVLPGWTSALVPHETTSDVIVTPGAKP